jgi:hypothetical protein
MPLKLMTESAMRRKDEDEAKRKAVAGYKKGGKVPMKAFKACAGCPSPAKCKAMGKCMKKK